MTPTKLHQWALEQLPTINAYLSKYPLNPNVNVLMEETPFQGLYLFAIHLGLWGWPDSDDELYKLLEYALFDWSIPFSSIINKWGVEPCCVLGGYETLHTEQHTIDSSNISHGSIPKGIEEQLFDIIGDSSYSIK